MPDRPFRYVGSATLKRLAKTGHPFDEKTGRCLTCPATRLPPCTLGKLAERELTNRRELP